MRTKWTAAVIVAALLLQGAVAARGQESPKSGGSIAELKEQIARLASVESDETVPADVKALNRKFLEERRAQLRALLQKNLDATRTYRATVASSLTADELAVVDGSIQALEKELQNLPSEVQPAPAAARAWESLAPNATTTGAVNASGDTLSRTERAAPAAPPASPAGAPAVQDLVPTGSDPDPNSENEIRDSIRRELGSVVRDITAPRLLRGQSLKQGREEAMDFGANPMLFALLLSNKTLPREEFVKDIEAARIDKQVGGTQGNAGSTTLVSKGGTPAVIAFAVENGGLTREVNGTTVTLRGNPVGLVESFQKQGFIPSYQDSQSTQLLRKLSFSVSFDTSRGDTPGTFLANRQQLSGYSLRYEFKNDRDPRNPKYRKRWASLVSGHAQEVANLLGRNQRILDTQPAYVAWRDAARKAIATATEENMSNEQLSVVIAQQFEAFQAIEIPPEVAEIIESFRTEFTAYRQERGKLLDIVANSPIFTFEYVNDRRPGLIDTSTLNFIAETGLFEGKADLTYNGSLTFFNSSPGAGMKRIRNFDHAVRLDVPIGDMRTFGSFLTFAGRYTRLMEDDLTAGGIPLSSKGDMATGQLLFTIPIKGTGFKIPLSLSFANRSEFIKEKEIRGNFGFTFDLDSILQNLKPF